MEDKRRHDDSNWDDIKEFIAESREYRCADQVKQDYQVKSIDALNEKVKIQNGRIGKLEDWRNEILGKKDLINFCLSFAAVVAAFWALLSKRGI